MEAITIVLVLLVAVVVSGIASRLLPLAIPLARVQITRGNRNDPEPDVHAPSLASQLQTLVHLCE